MKTALRGLSMTRRSISRGNFFTRFDLAVYMIDILFALMVAGKADLNEITSFQHTICTCIFIVILLVVYLHRCYRNYKFNHSLW